MSTEPSTPAGDRVVTQYVLNFIEARRHLWNAHVLRDREFVDDFVDSDTSEVFSEIHDKLLKLLVEVPLRLKPDAKEPRRLVTEANQQLTVQPKRKRPYASASDVVVLCSSKEGRYNTEAFFHWTPDCSLFFVDVYDWDGFGFAAGKYAEVFVERCPSLPDEEGRDALVEASMVDFVLSSMPIETYEKPAS